MKHSAFHRVDAHRLFGAVRHTSCTNRINSAKFSVFDIYFTLQVVKEKMTFSVEAWLTTFAMAISL